MKRLFFGALTMGLVGAFALAASVGHADGAEVTIKVRIKGEGPPIRLQIYESPWPGHRCESSFNRKLFDGSVSVGQTIEVSSSELCFCYRNTNGYFRNSDWESERLSCFSTLIYPATPELRVNITARKP